MCAAAGHSPRARERAKGARPTTGFHKTLCKPRMRLASKKFFSSGADRRQRRKQGGKAGAAL